MKKLSRIKKIICILLGLVFVFLVVREMITPHYMEKMIAELKANEKVRVGDIFDFDFNRAYIIHDCYNDGEVFAKRYDLDISIKEVKSARYEDQRRIVFVDNSGDFVYLFEFTTGELNVYDQTVVIYPDTIIEMSEPKVEGAVTIKFNSDIHFREPEPYEW